MQGSQPEDLTPVAYRAIIEGLLRYADLDDVDYHHQGLLQRAYDACGIETELRTRFHRGRFEYQSVQPKITAARTT